MLLITGANGFLGQHLAPLALKYFKSSEILCLISKTMRNPKLERRGIKILKKHGIKMLKVDLVTGEGLDKLPKSPEIVIHLAASSDTSLGNHQANDLGTKNLIDALEPLNFNTHVVYSSTIAMISGREDCSNPIDEYTIPCPTNEYGRTKLIAEDFLKKKCKEEKFRLTIARISTIYGSDPRTYKLFKVLERYIIGGSPLAWINWPGLTSLIHVEDVARALLKLAKIPPNTGKPATYVLSSESLTLSEISRIMHEKIGMKYKSINLPKSVWRFCSTLRKYIPILEKITPPSIYNLAWRWGLIVDNVMWCESNKLFNKLPKFKVKKFKDHVNEVLS